MAAGGLGARHGGLRELADALEDVDLEENVRGNVHGEVESLGNVLERRLVERVAAHHAVQVDVEAAVQEEDGDRRAVERCDAARHERGCGGAERVKVVARAHVADRDRVKVAAEIGQEGIHRADLVGVDRHDAHAAKREMRVVAEKGENLVRNDVKGNVKGEA